MKNFFKFLFIFFMMFISLSLNSSDFSNKEIQIIPTIQATTKENVVLVSNNLMNGEIYSYQEENNQNSSGNSHHLVSLNLNNKEFIKNKTQFNGCFIHNLSTNLKEVHQIRAP